MFELLSLALLISVIIAFITYVIRRLIPTVTLALLGGIVLLAIPIALLLVPNDRTIVGVANLAILYLLGNLLYFAFKGKVPSRAAMISLGLLVLFSLPLVSNILVQQEERGALRIAVDLTPESGPIVLLGRGATLDTFRPTPLESGVSPVQVANGDRIPYTVQLYQSLNPTLVIISGGPRIPRTVDKIDDRDQVVNEGTDIRGLLIALGVPSDRIVVEPDGIEFKDVAAGVNKILDARGLPKQVILVASAPDMVIARSIFQQARIDVAPAPTDFRSTIAPNSTRRIETGTLDEISQLLPSPEALSLSLRVFSHVIRNLSQELRNITRIL